MNEDLAYTPCLSKQADFYDLEYAAKMGRFLPDQSVLAMEHVLRLNPLDLVSRARLLGFYWNRLHSHPNKLSAEFRAIPSILSLADGRKSTMINGKFTTHSMKR